MPGVAHRKVSYRSPLTWPLEAARYLPAEVPYDDEDKFVEVLKKAGLTEG